MNNDFTFMLVVFGLSVIGLVSCYYNSKMQKILDDKPSWSFLGIGFILAAIISMLNLFGIDIFKSSEVDLSSLVIVILASSVMYTVNLSLKYLFDDQENKLVTCRNDQYTKTLEEFCTHGERRDTVD